MRRILEFHANLPAIAMALVAMALVLTAGIAAIGDELSPSVESSSLSAAHSREGSQLVDVLGSFKLSGDRATFYAKDGSGKYGGLENQTLERVANVIAEDPTPLEWQVSGTITEYRGTNYLLITRAILKTKQSASARPGGKTTAKPRSPRYVP